jgi:EmrB/QacA subfamily drug resistance transporter
LRLVRREMGQEIAGNTLATDDQAPQSIVLLLLCAAQFMVVLDFSIVNVALPTIQQSFGLPQAQLQWLVSAYALSFGGLLLLGGRAADLFGRRRIFIIGLTLFAAASLLGGLAPSAWQLVAARAVQGLAAALLSPAALSLLSTTFPTGRTRQRAFGIYGALGASGFAIGVFLGGLLTDGPGWRWVFFVNVPVGVVAALLAPRLLPEGTSTERRGPLDVAGALTGTAGLCLLVYGLTEAANWGWTSLGTWLCLVGAIGMLALFVWIEAHARGPLLPLRVLRNRPIVVADLIALLTTAAVAPQVFVLTLYLQSSEGLSAVQTGLLFLVQGASAVLGAIVGSRGVATFGVRTMLAGGRLVAALALGLMALALGRPGALPLLIVSLALVGLGNVCTFVAASIAATSSVGPGESGLASGLLYTAQQVGAALGLSALVSVAATRTNLLLQSGADASTATVDGFRLALVGAAGLTVVATIVAAAVAVEKGEPMPKGPSSKDDEPFTPAEQAVCELLPDGSQARR